MENQNHPPLALLQYRVPLRRMMHPHRRPEQRFLSPLLLRDVAPRLALLDNYRPHTVWLEVSYIFNVYFTWYIEQKNFPTAEIEMMEGDNLLPQASLVIFISHLSV